MTVDPKALEAAQRLTRSQTFDALTGDEHRLLIFDAVATYCAALPQGAAAAGVKVKPLEWDDLTSPREDGPHEPTGDVAAETMIGYYSVCFDPDEDAVAAPWCAWSANECIGHFATLDAANAAAHADYSQRILSALSPDPTGALLKQAVDALTESVKQLDAIIDDGIPTDFKMWRDDLRTALAAIKEAGH